MKRAVLFGMIGLWALGWVNTASHLTEGPRAYRALIAQAEEYEQKSIYIRAIQSYEEALTYQPDSLDLKYRIAKLHLELGDEASYINHCESIMEEYGYPLEIAAEVTDYYLEKERTQSAISFIRQTLKAHPESEEMKERFEKVRYTYQKKYLSYEEIFPVYNGCAVYFQEGKYGVMRNDGRTILRNNWNETSVWSDDHKLIPVTGDDGAYYVNENGYRFEVPEETQKVEWLGPLNGNVAAAKINGKYGYIDQRFHELSEFQWDGATGITDNLGAVKKNERWALIDGSGALLSDYIYEDVKVDVYGFGSTCGRMFVKQGGSFQMVNQKGEAVGDETFEDAVPFMSSQPTAVKKNGKWGFVDVDGAWVIEPQYENAEGFSDGLAPVQTGEKWGFINQENELVIAAEFYGAHSFYGGFAPVKDGNTWTMIELNVH